MVGRMIVNKWQIVIAVCVLLLLEIQILRVKETSPSEGEISVSKNDRNNRQPWSSEPKLEQQKDDQTSNDLDKDSIIFYNRVPKTGSTTFMGVIYALCGHNKFHALHLNVSKNIHVLTLPDQVRFARNITRWKNRLPAVYHGHLAYLEFERLGITKTPFYINIVRKPLERLVSYYYFLRYGDNFRPYLKRSRQGDKETFDDCVRKNHVDCQVEKLWLQIPYFCGHSPQCWTPGNKWALDQAKNNLVEKYLVVGVTEEIPAFVAILEATLPRFFKGAVDVLKREDKAHLRKTATKKELEPDTIAHFQETKIWKMENDFYEFAYKIFIDVKKRTLFEKNGEVVALKQQYFYEKIRPRIEM